MVINYLILLTLSVLCPTLFLALMYTPVKAIFTALISPSLAPHFLRVAYIGTFLPSVAFSMSSGSSYRMKSGSLGLEVWLEHSIGVLTVSSISIFLITLIFSFAMLGIVRAKVIAGKDQSENCLE